MKGSLKLRMVDFDDFLVRSNTFVPEITAGDLTPNSQLYFEGDRSENV